MAGLEGLSPAYRHRLERYAAKHGVSLSEARTAARGHAKTPEHPDRAHKRAGVYRDYIQRRNTLERQVAAKKEALWGSSVHFRPGKSLNAVIINPATKRPPSLTRMEAFLQMTDDEIDDIDRDDDEWGFLFYH